MQTSPGENPYRKLVNGGLIRAHPLEARRMFPRINHANKTFQELLDEAEAQGEYLCVVHTPDSFAQEVRVVGSEDEHEIEYYLNGKSDTTFHRISEEWVPERFFKNK